MAFLYICILCISFSLCSFSLPQYGTNSINLNGMDQKGSAKTYGDLDVVGVNNSGKIKAVNNVGNGGSAESNLIGTVQGRNNKLKVQKAKSNVGAFGSSTHNFISDIGPGNVGVVNSKQVGGMGSLKNANLLDKVSGNGFKVNNVLQTNNGGKNSINHSARLSGIGGTIVNNFKNGGGSVNSAVDSSNSKGSTVFNMVQGGKTSISTDRQGNSILNIGTSVGGSFKASRLSG
jgi:hypothetical protein